MGSQVSALRDGSWLTRTRVARASSLLLVGYVAALAWTWSGSGVIDPLGRPVGTDFLSFWTAAQSLHLGRVDWVYAPDAFAARQVLVTGLKDQVFGWFYPPVTLLLVYPLAWAPYLASLGGWMAVSVAAYLSALARIRPGRSTLLAGAAFPAVFLAVAHGQNALLLTAVLGWGLILLRSSPGVAGVLLGLLSVKPQLALLVPVALVAGRHWRALAAAATTVLALVTATLVAFGPQAWRAWWAVSELARRTLELGIVPHAKFQSVFAAMRLAHMDMVPAYGIQVAVSLAAATAVGWAWSRAAAPATQNAVLVCAGVLATPFVLDYDLSLLALAGAWLCSEGEQRGFLAWEKTLLASAALLPIVARNFALATGMALAPPMVAGLLGLLLVRIARDAQAVFPALEASRG